MLRKDTIISGFMHDKLMKVVSRLLDDEPLQYILGKTRFSMNIDERFMYRAIQLAKNGKGNTSPNPIVGAVIVHDGTIIGEGYHRRCGGPVSSLMSCFIALL